MQLLSRAKSLIAQVPLLGWLIAVFCSVLLESYFGTAIAKGLGLPKVPVLFGLLIMLKTPALIPHAVGYVAVVYLLPTSLIAILTASVMNRAADKLLGLSELLALAVHTILLYLILHLWAQISDYQLLTLKYTLIMIMLTLSLNVINGYMGEFSCSHPGFMAMGAYSASVFSMAAFTASSFFGGPLLPEALGPWLFPVALIMGGLVTAMGALVIAVLSFRTRGDYLAVISLAFTFIIKSVIENLEFVGGPRGLRGQPDYASLPVIFLWTVGCVWMINNYVSSTMGKALNTIRDDEIAAEAMTIDTRHTKMVGFMFAAFWAGIAGGLYAHSLRYINPAMFGVQNLAEVLAMVYFGGLNSVYGSIVGAVSLSLLSEALRPLEIFKWIIIPLLLILVMVFRPTGLVAFKEFDVKKLIGPKRV